MKKEVDYASLNDLELINLLKGGDKDAYTQIFFRYNRLLYVHAYKMLGDKEEARDVVQEIFASLWEKKSTIELKSNLPGFLYTSTRNKILDLFSHQAVASKYVLANQAMSSQTEDKTDFLVRTNELSAIIEKEIAFLPAKMQEIFNLSRKDNLSHKEIAEKLHLTEKTVKNQVNNALKILRGRLKLLIYLLLILS